MVWRLVTREHETSGGLPQGRTHVELQTSGQWTEKVWRVKAWTLVTQMAGKQADWWSRSAGRP